MLKVLATIATVVVYVWLLWWAGTSLTKGYKPVPVQVFGFLLLLVLFWPLALFRAYIRIKAAK
jgi:hypothetical protein